MSSIPFFVAEEKTAFQRLLSRHTELGKPIFLVRCRNLASRPKDIEYFAAAFLLMNLLLMQKWNKRILKLVHIEEEQRDSVFPVLNMLRHLFEGEFAALETMEKWQEILQGRVQIKDPSLDLLKGAIGFVKGAEIAVEIESFHKAEVYLGVDESRFDPPHSTLFEIEQLDVFTSQVRCDDVAVDLFLPEIFAGESVTVRMNRGGNIIEVQVDVTGDDWLEVWMRNVEVITSAKFYASEISR